MDDHVALGDRTERVHVRLFGLLRHTILAAHHEIGDGCGNHVVTTWDGARAETAQSLERSGFRRLGSSAPITPLDLRGVPSDGRVWRLARR
jgi:hypothetical protein